MQPYLNGLHRIILVQLVDMVRDVGIKRSRGDWMDYSCIMGLLLITLAIRVSQKRQKATENGTAQPHSRDVEHIKLWQRQDNVHKRLCLHSQSNVDVTQAELTPTNTACDITE